jgi:hypothetical protein
MLRKHSVQQVWLSLMPTARCRRCLRPVGDDAALADQHSLLGPARRSDSNTASTNTYFTLISERFRVMKA